MLTDIKNKKREKPNFRVSVNNLWLGIVNLFQTFEDLESVKDKQADTQAVRQVLDEEDGAEVRLC